ncbi:MAG: hypothetical protein OEZ43_21055 [Gammaproteobacteria bacterium]|nr:hypothetical protein [Gammaproteobacteria bacterium]
MYEGAGDLHAPVIDWLLQNDQWLAYANGVIHGWVGWFLLDDDSRALFRHDGFLDALGQRSIELSKGRHLYIAEAVVAPWAPRQLLWQLKAQAIKANPGVQSVCAHVRSKGTVRWLERTIH